MKINSNQVQKIREFLTYTGFTPFILFTLMLTFEFYSMPLLGGTKEVLTVYTLIIASFVSGIHWGQHITLDNKWNIYLPMLSIIHTIVFWLAYCILPLKTLFLVFILGFLTLLLIDKYLLRDRIITSEYFLMRSIATTIVIISLIFSRRYLC